MRGCTTPFQRSACRITPRSRPRSRRMNRYIPGNRIALLRSGTEFFPALLEAIDGAAREIWLETYIYADDESGRRVSAALLRAVQRGVLVRIMVDGWGARHYLTRRLERDLVQGGLQVL